MAAERLGVGQPVGLQPGQACRHRAEHHDGADPHRARARRDAAPGPRPQAPGGGLGGPVGGPGRPEHPAPGDHEQRGQQRHHRQHRPSTLKPQASGRDHDSPRWRPRKREPPGPDCVSDGRQARLHAGLQEKGEDFDTRTLTRSPASCPVCGVVPQSGGGRPSSHQLRGDNSDKSGVKVVRTDGKLAGPARPCAARAVQKLPRRSCSRSMASNRALKLPLPKPSEPCRSMNSKKTVGRSPIGAVKICSR